MLPNGEIIHCVSVSASPTAFVIIRNGACESSAEAEADIDCFTSPRTQVKRTYALFSEVVPSVIGSKGIDTVVVDALGDTANGLLVLTIEVKATPHRGTRGACTADVGFLWAGDNVPSGLSTANFDHSHIVPDIPYKEITGCVSATEGSMSKMLEQFNAHEGTIRARKVNIFEDHSVVPVLVIPAP